MQDFFAFQFNSIETWYVSISIDAHKGGATEEWFAWGRWVITSAERQPPETQKRRSLVFLRSTWHVKLQKVHQEKCSTLHVVFNWKGSQSQQEHKHHESEAKILMGETERHLARKAISHTGWNKIKHLAAASAMIYKKNIGKSNLTGWIKKVLVELNEMLWSVLSFILFFWRFSRQFVLK